MSSWPSLSNALKGSRFNGWPAPVPMKLTHRTVQVISNGDLLCFSNRGSCRRSFDASSQSVAFDEYSTGLLILAPTLSKMFAQMMLWPWSNAKSAYEAPSQTPWIHCRGLGRQTMQVTSNGGLLCADGALMPWSAEGHTRLCLAGRPYPMLTIISVCPHAPVFVQILL